MRYKDERGQARIYPSSFGADDLDRLEDFIGARPVLGMESARISFKKNIVVMRHDVDHSIEHAVKFAQWEYDRGYQSTYFLLHSAWYWQHEWGRTVECIQEIAEYGHEIGIHNDAVSQAWWEGYRGHELWQQAANILQGELFKLREIVLRVRGTSAHGGTGPVANIDLWNNCLLPSFDLFYEAYFQSRKWNSFISDNRGQWRAPMIHHEDRQTHMLLHPCHWQFDD